MNDKGGEVMVHGFGAYVHKVWAKDVKEKGSDFFKVWPNSKFYI